MMLAQGNGVWRDGNHLYTTDKHERRPEYWEHWRARMDINVTELLSVLESAYLQTPC